LDSETIGNGHSPKYTSRFYYGYIIIVLGFIIHLITFSLIDSYGVFINPWNDDFGWSRAAISWAMSVCFIVMGVISMLMGIITDKYGPRIALSICALCLGAGLLLISRMQALWELYLYFGVIFGIGMSGIWAPLLSLISRWFVKRRGLITGIVISGGGLGAVIGPLVITNLIDAYTWRNSALILGIIVLVVIFLAAQFLKRDPSQIGLKPLGHEQDQHAESTTKGLTLKEAIKTAKFWIIFSMLFCLAFYTFSVLVHIVPHAIELNIPAFSAAIILSSIGAAGIAGNWVMGPICDRIGPKKVYIISFALMSASLFWVVLSGDVWWMLITFAIVFGFNHGGVATAQAPLLARIFGLRAHGSIYSVVLFGFTIGGATGQLLSGYVFDITGSYQAAFILSAVIGIVGIILSVILRPTRQLI